MHNRACVSFSTSRHMIIFDKFNGMSSVPFDCIIFRPLTSCNIMKPTSRHNKSSNKPFLPAADFSFIEIVSSSLLLLLRAIIEPPKRLWFCAFDLIIEPIASRVSTWSFGSTVMVAGCDKQENQLTIITFKKKLRWLTLHHLDFCGGHRWQVIVWHQIAKFGNQLKCAWHATAHLIEFTANARHHLIWVGCQDECDINGILPNGLMEDAFANHESNRVNYHKIVEAKI